MNNEVINTLVNNEVINTLVIEYMKPYYLEWEKNGTSEEFIRGYKIAIEHVCLSIFGEDGFNIFTDKVKEKVK